MVCISLSFSQQRLWFIDELEGSLQYHMPIVLRIDGALDIEALSSSFKEIVNRHEVLRTVIKSEDGVAYQEVMPADAWSLEVVRLEGTADMESLLHSYVSIPFDLSSDYMVRMCLYDPGDGSYILAGVIHHIASDGWSEDVFVQELGVLYSCYSQGRVSDLSPLSLQYIDYALWQRKYIEGDVLEAELSYWQDQLADVTPLALPTDYPRGSVRSTDGLRHEFELDSDLSASLQEVCKEEGVTLYMLLLAAFKVLMHR